jgi:large subunit ribosomal protein L32
VAVPKRKTSRSRRDMRRAHHDKVTAPNIIPCPKCGDMTLPHRVCASCGYYKGRKIVEIADSAAGESGA